MISTSREPFVDVLRFETGPGLELISTHVVTLKSSPFPVAPTINPKDSRHTN